MSGVIAGYLPGLPRTPAPTGLGARELEKRRMGAPPRPVVVGELFGCWRVVEQAPSCPKQGVQVLVECVHCGARATRIATYLRREPPTTHRSCPENR